MSLDFTDQPVPDAGAPPGTSSGDDPGNPPVLQDRYRDTRTTMTHPCRMIEEGPPGLPAAEGEFVIRQIPVTPPATDAPVPDSDSDDSQATRDYGESSLASLVEGEEDVLLVLPHDLSPPQWAVFDGDRKSDPRNWTSSRATWIMMPFVLSIVGSWPRT